MKNRKIEKLKDWQIENLKNRKIEKSQNWNTYKQTDESNKLKTQKLKHWESRNWKIEDQKNWKSQHENIPKNCYLHILKFVSFPKTMMSRRKIQEGFINHKFRINFDYRFTMFPITSKISKLNCKIMLGNFNFFSENLDA